ncbi:MAG TPA: hypothetical protein VIM79_04790, partial [Niastella sp.]
DEVQASEYPFMAYDYVQYKQRENDELAAAVSNKMIEIYGDDWKKTIEELKQNYTKKKIRQVNAEELA